MDVIGFVPQNKSGFVISEDFESVSEKERVELVEENFEATGETKDGNKWDRTYEANAYTALN